MQLPELLPVAAKLFQESADHDFVPSLTCMGIISIKHSLFSEASPWFKRAAQRGDIGAQYFLGSGWMQHQDIEDLEMMKRWPD